MAMLDDTGSMASRERLDGTIFTRRAGLSGGAPSKPRVDNEWLRFIMNGAHARAHAVAPNVTSANDVSRPVNTRLFTLTRSPRRAQYEPRHAATRPGCHGAGHFAQLSSGA